MYVLCTADLCATILCVTPSLGKVRQAAITVWSAHTALFLDYYFSLYHNNFSYFFNYSYYFKTKLVIWVGIHCRNQANHIIDHGG